MSDNRRYRAFTHLLAIVAMLPWALAEWLDHL